MEIIKLKTRTRTGTGKSYTRKARSSGWVPATYYSKKIKPVCIEVDEREFAAIVRKRHLTNLIDLGLGKTQEDSIAVIKEVQRHVIKDNFFYHIDFQHVAMNEKVTVQCPIEIVGTAIGVKGCYLIGHYLQQTRRDFPEYQVLKQKGVSSKRIIHTRAGSMQTT